MQERCGCSPCREEGHLPQPAGLKPAGAEDLNRAVDLLSALSQSVVAAGTMWGGGDGGGGERSGHGGGSAAKSFCIISLISPW